LPLACSPGWEIMANLTKRAFLDKLAEQYAPIRRLEGSQSLYDIAGGAARIYIRYSKVHSGHRTFYGLRQADLQRLQGHPSLVCFLWEGQLEPLMVPYADYEDVFESTSPAGDGQYKAQVYLRHDGIVLYIARAGNFNAEANMGWAELENLIDSLSIEPPPVLSHPQIQTLLGAVGSIKEYDVWIPHSDRTRLDWSVAKQFSCRETAFPGLEAVQGTIQQVDVVWIRRGSNDVKALFEVEHSTPVYSGLLRLNDIHLAAPRLDARFSVVANQERRSAFVRQVNRPTFQASGLAELCTFLEYTNVYQWHSRVRSGGR